MSRLAGRVRARALVLLAGVALVALTACAEQPEVDASTATARRTPAISRLEGEVNGCSDANLLDTTLEGRVTVHFGEAAGNHYQPRCVLAKPGGEIRFEGEFALHPMAGGTVRDGELSRDLLSPIPLLDAGEVAVFRSNEPGVYPFYCQVHWILGMNGAVVVR